MASESGCVIIVQLKKGIQKSKARDAPVFRQRKVVLMSDFLSLWLQAYYHSKLRLCSSGGDDFFSTFDKLWEWTWGAEAIDLYSHVLLCTD
jgi:hypothetical protein